MIKNLSAQIAYLAFGLCIAILFISAISHIAVIYRASIPASAWFQVHSVHVEDSVVGADPPVTVVRTVHRKFIAEWIAEVQTPTGVAIEGCYGRGRNTYGTNIPRTLKKPLFSWWLGRPDCKLKPGEYQVETTWRLLIPGYPEKHVSTLSNVFRVTQ